MKEMEKREADSAAYIRPQEEWADMVVRFRSNGAPGDDSLGVHLTMRPTLSQPDLASVLSQVGGEGKAPFALSAGDDGERLSEFLEIDGHVTDQQALAIEEAIWSQQPDLKHLLPAESGTFLDGNDERRSNPLALTQLMIAYHLLLGRLAKERMSSTSQIAAGTP